MENHVQCQLCGEEFKWMYNYDTVENRYFRHLVFEHKVSYPYILKFMEEVKK